jgi:L-ascorbate metabolism protein UlaG (beta-lactamase superfamily)
MSPDDAIQAMAMLGAKEMIPIHWGSFRIAYDGIDEPKEVLLELVDNGSLKERIHILENGEKYLFK